MAKRKEMMNKMAESKAQLAKAEAGKIDPKKEPKKGLEPKPNETDAGAEGDSPIAIHVRPMEDSEPEPEPADVSEPVSEQAEPELMAPEAPIEPEPESIDDMKLKAAEMREFMAVKVEQFEAKRLKFEAEIAELEAQAAEQEKLEAEAKAKAAAEEKARQEAEEKAKAEAEAREKAKAEARALQKADLLASINKADKPRVGKAYKWWDYESATWNITADVWHANQLSDKWEVVYVWYVDGQIQRLLNKEELEKHCPR